MTRAPQPVRPRNPALAAACAKAGIRYSRLAAQINVHPNAVSDWLNNRSRPTVEHAVAAAQILNARPAELFPDVFGRDGGAA